MILPWVLLLISGTHGFAGISDRTPEKTALCNNYVFISGKSNINNFSFYYDIPANRTDNILKTNIEKQNVEISIPIREFEASNPLMYEDFLNMLKASDYPLIKISFHKQQIPVATNISSVSNPEIIISIAGVSKTYKIPCSLLNCSYGIYLTGIQTVRLTDFRLIPPVKLKGLVRVEDEINVDFGFIITFTDHNNLASEK